MKDLLFTPITINGMELKNRITMPAMHLGMAANYEVNDQILEFYRVRGKGGASLITVGYATVDDLSGNPQNIGAHDDAYIPGLAKLAQAIQQGGAKAAVQLNHAGRYNHSFMTGGKQPIAPSAIASRMTRETPKEMTEEEIQAVIANFAAAAGRVKKAGYDAVEVLSGTGYLLSEFLSPITNQREDGWGGSLANRMRFGLEVMKAIRAEVGPEFPVLVRMNGNDFMPNGNGREELKDYAAALVEEAGVDALCINVGWHEARIPQIVTSVPRGVFGYLSKGIKDRVTVPVIASHRINDPETAREMLADGLCDLVAMGRSLIADPDLPNKAMQKNEEEIVHCVACAQGCFDHLFKLRHVECLCNPKAGHEYELDDTKTAAAKKVLIIGGGAAGMSAACEAHDRGHEVVLYEKNYHLGGQLYLAAAPPGRDEFAELAHDMSQQVAARGIRVEFGTEVTEAIIEAEKPDYVILATGALPLTPPIKGIDGPNVLQAWDVLEGTPIPGENVVVIGGGAVGVETSMYIAEMGTLDAESVKFLLVQQAETPEALFEMATKGSKKVTMVEMIDKIGKDIGKSTRWVMMQDMDRENITVITKAKALEIDSEGILLDIDGKEEKLAADCIVVAAGAEPHLPLTDVLDAKGIPYKIAGDAAGVALAFDAVHQGFAAGRAIE